MESKKKKAIGIDLGTTYSCVAVFENNRVVVINNKMGYPITPSIVAFTPEGKVVGESAKIYLSKEAKNTVYDSKRMIGQQCSAEVVQNDKKNWPFEVLPDAQGRVQIKVSELGQAKTYYPEQISAIILQEMKQIAEIYLGYEVKDAVITVPAYFNQAQKMATQDAGKIAGLNVLRIINEPTAASLAFDIENRTVDDRNILVFDFGGGTFDVTVLCIGDGVNEVKSTSGDTHLGGQDLDTKFVEYCVQQFKEKTMIDLSNDKSALSRLREKCKKVKELLSSETEAKFTILGLAQSKDLDFSITRAKFEQICDPIFKKLLPPITEALEHANLTKKDIQEIIMVGGSTRIPKVKTLIQNFFDGKTLNFSVNPDEAVAAGAAIQAAKLTGDESKLIKNIFLLDVVPLTLGVSLSSGLMSPFIKRNTPIPIKITQNYETAHDNQTELRVQIWEGERPVARDNHFLGDMYLRGLTPAPKGEIKFEESFEIDANGILRVIATETKSKQTVQTTINTRTLPQETVEKLIAEAQANSKQDAMTKTILDVQISFEFFCDVLKKRCSDPRISFSQFEVQAITTAYNNGYQYAQGLKLHARNIQDPFQMEPYIKSYYEELAKLEAIVNPIMEKVHKKAGLIWRGRKETAALINEEQTKLRTTHSQFFEGDLD